MMYLPAVGLHVRYDGQSLLRSLNPTGQVQTISELWTAELAEGSGKIRKGDKVEVVRVEGLRLKVKKKD